MSSPPPFPFSGKADDTLRYFLADDLGSVVALVDGDTGNVTTSYSYDAFGDVTINGSDENPFQYTGRENDGTGLYYCRARYYSPTLRRFISEDPIGLAGGLNFYSYVQNNPVNFIDPMGLFNPAKGFSALGNAAIAGFSAGSGTVKVLIAAGASPASATGVGSLPSIALAGWGAWNFKSSQAAWSRATQQMKEALCEDWEQASPKNFYGMLPNGTLYDDPGEYSGPVDFIKDKGWWKFLKDVVVF